MTGWDLPAVTARLDRRRLTAALLRLPGDPGRRDRARELGAAVRREDGVRRAVERLEPAQEAGR